MIKFFRKIRQNLLIENKTGKYFKYAIGEIVLVVIGILIALQLNNWNEIRKSRLEGLALLENLIVDLESDLAYFESLKQEYNGWLDQIDQVLDNVLNQDEVIITEINQYSAGRSSMNFLNVNKISFSEMFNSGKNLKFDNTTIVKDIKNYFQYVETELYKLNSDNEIFLNRLLEANGVTGVNTWQRLYHGQNVDQIDWSWRTNANSELYKAFEGNTLYYKLAIEANLKVIDDLEEKSQALIESISKELDRH